MGIIDTLSGIAKHPLNRNSRLSAIKRYCTWQIGSRLVPGPVAVNFVNDARLLVNPGMTGATGNIYSGLQEFEDMAFLLHLLRPGELFVDVGANIGSYTILASAAIGAKTIAFEPLPQTFRQLRNNIFLNNVGDIAQAHNLGIGKEDGALPFTAGLDTENHVATLDEEKSGGILEAKVVSLDSILGDKEPKLIKIDVEGFEANVIAGAARVLSRPGLDAVIMEQNGSGVRYGFDEKALARQMIEYGFTAFTYSPFERTLRSWGKNISQSGNIIHVRNVEHVKRRLESAPSFRVLRHHI